MELFNEIYSCYYHTVRHILAEAARPFSEHERNGADLQNQAFQETALAVLPKLTKGEWPLLFPSKEHPGCYESALHFLLPNCR